MLECVMRLRPFCHGVGFQSDGHRCTAGVEHSRLRAAIVVPPMDKGVVPVAKLGKFRPAHLRVAEHRWPHGDGDSR